jgi:hypothetical protein
MCRKLLVLGVVVVLIQTSSLRPAPAADGDGGRATVRPEETDEILANPGIGWETFHHTAGDDANLPPWIPSTLHYARWGWGTLEPSKGRIDFDFLDGVLKETRQAGQKLAFRAMCCSTTPGKPYHPAWLAEIGGRVETTTYSGGRQLEIPVLDDPVVLEAHLDFIKRLGARYDGHADVDHVDLGSVGWWGEWHMSGSPAEMPTLEARKKIVDAYLAAFRKTPLVMLVGGDEMLRYATENGTGWRADCLGDMGGFSRTWCHMRMAYPQELTAAGATDAWKTAPVAWETCWDMRKWKSEGWPLRFIFNYALALHGSCINNKSAPLPVGDDVRPEVERFLRRLGYRLVLRELSHAKAAKPGEILELKTKWQNVGSAPCYKPYRVAYRLAGAGGYERVFASDVAVSGWLPGSIELFTEDFFKQPADLPPGEIIDVADSVRLPGDLEPGSYTLSVGIVGEDGEKPVVRLAVKGRDEAGWYPLSEVVISR